jgi:hypothetical protein
LSVTQILNPTYATTIATAFQVALQATIDALTFAHLMGEFF